jgi:hypothetical protein
LQIEGEVEHDEDEEREHAHRKPNLPRSQLGAQIFPQKCA